MYGAYGRARREAGQFEVYRRYNIIVLAAFLVFFIFPGRQVKKGLADIFFTDELDEPEIKESLKQKLTRTFSKDLNTSRPPGV